jgi:enoyl-CoA hydratase/carnithine racemase
MGKEVRLANYVIIEKGLGPEGRIAVVRFDRGDGINALSPEALRQLTRAARSFEDDGDTSVVVLTGGSKAFSAGFDLKDPEGRSRRTMDIGSLRRHLQLGPRLSRAWQEMEQVTIAAIEGFCIGGGVALAVALDFRVMARDAHLRVPEIGLGMNLSWQSIPRMLHLIATAAVGRHDKIDRQPSGACTRRSGEPHGCRPVCPCESDRRSQRRRCGFPGAT